MRLPNLLVWYGKENGLEMSAIKEEIKLPGIHCFPMIYFQSWIMLTLSLPITTKVPYANSLDLDETPSYFASHNFYGSKLFDTQPTFSPTSTDFEQHWSTLKIEADKNFADNLFCRLRVKCLTVLYMWYLNCSAVFQLSALYNCVPPEKPYQASQLSSFFMIILMVAYFLMCIPIGYVLVS